MLSRALVVVAVLMAGSYVCCDETSTTRSEEGCPPMVTRSEWGAREPKLRENMTSPVDSVIIHHTYIPGACDTLDRCVGAMKAMQRFHMDERGWNDIGYSFAIGGGRVLEGRGWTTVGAHAPRYNNHSIGIAFIGDYREQLPSSEMLSLAKSMIQCGMDSGYIDPDYQLLGHRQVRDTECPGEALYQLIQTWSHWRPQPAIEVKVTDTMNATE